MSSTTQVMQNQAELTANKQHRQMLCGAQTGAELMQAKTVTPWMNLCLFCTRLSVITQVLTASPYSDVHFKWEGELHGWYHSISCVKFISTFRRFPINGHHVNISMTSQSRIWSDKADPLKCKILISFSRHSFHSRKWYQPCGVSQQQLCSGNSQVLIN